MADDGTLDLIAKLKGRAAKVVDEAEKDKAPARDVADAEAKKRHLEEVERKTKESLKAMMDVTLDPKDAKAAHEFAIAVDTFEKGLEATRKGIDTHSKTIDMQKSLSRRKRKKVQVVFCFDATGSMNMGTIIGKVKETIGGITKELRIASSLDVEVGYQVYRDYDDAVRFEECQLTGNPQVFSEKIKDVVATGGGDAAEDVLGGLNRVVTEFAWDKKQLHVCVWCGDAPGHGLGDESYRTRCDNHPTGDKFGLTVPKVASDFIENKITLAFLRVNDSTDRMIRMFSNEFVAGGIPVIQHGFEDVASCGATIKKMIIEASSASQTTGGGGAREKRPVPYAKDVDGEPPKITLTKGQVFVRDKVEIDPAAADKMAIELLKAMTPDALKLKAIALAKPLTLELPYFAAGGIRFAHMAETGGTKVVAKDFQWGEDALMRHVHETKSTVIADTLCALFRLNLGLHGKKDPFSYVRTQIYDRGEAAPDAAQSRFYSLEEYKEGRFIKFNSNAGYIDKEYEMPQAFSHFTYQVTDGRMMVLDLQGWCEGGNYTLTDPAIMTADYALLPTDTNRGAEAMEEFMRAHECGETCRKLHLTKFTFAD